jgi:endonuclease/exonuclease/phosphatase family metal-dependent hydrolase
MLIPATDCLYPQAMRLLSYNIHKCIGGRDRLYRPERVFRVIEHEAPDLICLQEVDRNVPRSRGHDQASMFAEHFGFAHVFQLNHKLKQGGYGNLVLSRWPITEHHHLSLRFRNKKVRGAQVVRIESPCGPLRLVNWHLGLSDRERQWQVAHLLSHPAYRALDGLPTVIAGDFNDWRNALCIGALCGPNWRHLTAPPSRFRSFPAWLPVGSLDKAFACERIRLERAHTIGSMLARKASDHLPLVLDFEIA